MTPSTQASPKVAPQVAIIIPVRDGAGAVMTAVTSALAQSAAVEVIVVDDASRDATPALLADAAVADPRLRVLRSARNAGPAAARNRALRAASAPWIAPLDADDRMAPDRVARLLATARAGEWDFVADDVLKVDAAGAAAPKRLWSDSDFGATQIDLAGFVQANIAGARGRRRELGFVKPLMRRAFLDRHGLAYDETLRLGEDYALYAAALARGARFLLVDPCGYEATVRADSLSGAHATADLGALLEADHRLLRDERLAPGARRALRRHARAVRREWTWRRLIDAVKARDARAAAGCFAAPPSVVVALAAHLGRQAALRGGRRLGVGAGRASPRRRG